MENKGTFSIHKNELFDALKRLQRAEKVSRQRSSTLEITQLLAFQKHLDKIADSAKSGANNTISFAAAIEGILKFQELHIQMDTAALDAYGWGTPITNLQLRTNKT